MNVRIESSWQQRLQSEFDKPYFENLTAFVRHEYATKTVYPPGSQIFRVDEAVKVIQLFQAFSAEIIHIAMKNFALSSLY